MKEKILNEIEQKIKDLTPYLSACSSRVSHEAGCKISALEYVRDMIKDIQDEHASENLEEAAANCYYHNHAFARESFIEGVEWQKKQMMKDVIEATIIKTRVTNQTTAPTLSSVILSDAFHEGDKVKVKIFKEGKI